MLKKIYYKTKKNHCKILVSVTKYNVMTKLKVVKSNTYHIK